MKRDIMSRIATLALAAVAAGFGAVSCAEEEIEVEAPMQKVQFAAATRYDNLPATRTIYSGDEIEVGGQKTERIDWVDGDRIYVRGLTCDQYIHPGSGGELTVSSHQTLTGDSKVSVATLEGDANIHWAPNETNVFVAAYPSSTLYWETDSQISPRFMGYLPATQAQSASHTAGGQTVTNPSMDLAAMVAKESVTERPTDPVTLHFSPAFTAFEFNMAFAGASGSNTISKFEMESTTTHLVGNWEWNYNSGVNSFTCDGSNKKITVNFDNQVIDAEQPLRFTVFALPHEITNVTLKFYLGDNPTAPKTLSLKDKTTGVWEVFEPCKKYRISTPGAPADWEYVIECTDPSAVAYTGEIPTDYTNGTVTSYKQKPGGSDKTAVEWEVEGYYTDADCTPANKLDSKPYWMPGYDGSTGQDEAGPGSTTFENVGITYAHAHVTDSMETISTEAAQKNALIANHAVMGSAASPYNLSNPGNNGAAGYIQESANSYIVNGCGWYQIPLVMGNGVKNNALNPDETTYKGYNGTGDDKRILFKDYKGNNIQNPYLHSSSSGVGTPTSAEILWEDIEGLIESQKDADGHNTYELPSGCISQSNGVYWLKFRVPTVREGQWIHKDNWGSTGTTLRNEPRQGNAVIAVKDASGTTMWSYHIWVTDYIPKNYPGYDNSTRKDVNIKSYQEFNNSYDFPYWSVTYDFELPYRLMNSVLGFVTYGTTVYREYGPNTVWVKLVQPESGLTTVMEVNQNDGEEEAQLNRSQPFYQALRKDAFWPGNGLEGRVDPEWYGKVRTVQNPDGTRNVTLEKMTIAQTISEPHIIYQRGSDSGEWYVGNPVNLWTSRCKTILTDDVHYCEFDEIDNSIQNFHIAYFYNFDRFLLGVKTIYDPCPAGYIIPPFNMAMHTTGQGEHSGSHNYIDIAREDGLIAPYFRKYQGAWIGDCWAGDDGDNVTIYTDSRLKPNCPTFTLPYTGLRGNNGSALYAYKVVGPLMAFRVNSILYEAAVAGNFYYYSNGKFSRTAAAANPLAVLPIDDSYGPNPADFPGTDEYNAAHGGSPAPSASSALGRYTVMQFNPEFF